MNLLLCEICHYILLFFSFSVFGWCMEVTLKYFQYHRFINRGFLIGPYCPIYGAGAVFITLSVNAFSLVEKSYASTFIISFLVCGALEYAISFYMEKKFHARWWDYSTKPMNLNGRIWIGNLILFGIGGTIIVEVANPVLFHIFLMLSWKVLYVISAFICIAMLSDYIVSHFIMKFVKMSVEDSEADNTESISKEIRNLLTNKSVLYKRISDAYPNVIYRTERITEKIQKVKMEMEQLKEEANIRVASMEEKIQVQKKNIADIMQTPSEIKDEIISAQNLLINLLEQDNTDEQMKNSIKNEIKLKKEKLETKEKMFQVSKKEK